MKTQISVDDELIAEAMTATGLPQEATVEQALRTIIRHHLKRQAVEDLRGTGWEGDLDAMREGRFYPDR